MASDTDRHWRMWGKVDPYYAVVSFDRFRKANLESTRPEFFATGRTHADTVLATLHRHFGEMGRESALDFGCGVGRVAIALARDFDSVTGMDVSEEMLAESRKNLREFGVHNATLVLSDDRLSQAGGPFDLVHSYNVLQHVPVGRGMAIIAELLRRVRPGGAAMLHMSLRRHFSPLRRVVYHARHNLPLFAGASNVLIGRSWNEPPMQMNEYDFVQILRLFAAHGMKEVLAIPEEHGPITTAFFFGHKPAGPAASLQQPG